MHEYSVTEKILEIVQTEADRAGAGHVREVNLVLGELTSFVADSIHFYFDELSRGTVADGATLVVSEVPARAVCSGCGSGFRPVLHALTTCPGCGSAQFDIEKGQEFYIDSIETD